jgi:hypothetical protein
VTDPLQVTSLPILECVKIAAVAKQAMEASEAARFTGKHLPPMPTPDKDETASAWLDKGVSDPNFNPLEMWDKVFSAQRFIKSIKEYKIEQPSKPSIEVKVEEASSVAESYAGLSPETVAELKALGIKHPDAFKRLAKNPRLKPGQFPSWIKLSPDEMAKVAKKYAEDAKGVDKKTGRPLPPAVKLEGPDMNPFTADFDWDTITDWDAVDIAAIDDTKVRQCHRS